MNSKMKRAFWAIAVVAMLMPLCTMCKKSNGDGASGNEEASATDTVVATSAAYIDKSGHLVIPQRRVMDVNDYAGVLGDSARALEDDLRMYAAEVEAEITVVTMADIGSADPLEIATEIAQRWGVGKSADSDNGVVLLLVPDGKASKVAIATGDQLKDALSARYCRDLITDVTTPKLKADDYYGAVKGTVEDIVRTLASTQP